MSGLEPAPSPGPQDSHSRHQEGLVARKAGDHISAIAHFCAALELRPDSLPALLDLADDLIVLGQPAEARLAYLRALELDSKAVPALRGLVTLSRKSGDRPAALGFLKRLTEADATNLWFQADLAAELRELGRLDEAEATYREVLGRDPLFFPARCGLGHVERCRGRRLEALDHFTRAQELNKTDVWALHEMAIELTELGRLDEAEGRATQLLHIDPRFLNAHRALAQIARRRGDRAQLVWHLRQALALDAANTSSLADLAAALREDGVLDEAEDLYTRATKIDPRFMSAWRGLGHLARMRGRHEDALAHFARALDLDRQDKWSLFEVATQQRLLRRFDEARASFNSILRADAEFLPAQRGLAYIARESGDRNAALQMLRDIFAKRSDDVASRLDLAHELRDLNHVDEAETHFRILLDLDPTSVPVLRGLAHLARRRGRHSEARRHFERLRDLEGASDTTVADLAAELLMMGQREKARDLLTDFLADHPDSPRCLMTQAQALAGEASQAERLDALLRAAAAGRDFPEARCALAREYLRGGHLDRAREAFQSALEGDPSHVSALIGLGLTARAQGQTDEALAYFQTAVERHPASEGALSELARELVRAGRRDEALATLDVGLVRSANSIALALQKGHLLREAGDFTAAHAWFAATAHSFPESTQVAYETAACALQIGHIDEAVTGLTTLIARDPQHIQSLEMLGNIALQFDDVATAEAFYGRGMAVAPHLPGPAMNKARCTARRGRTDEALQLVEDVKRRTGATIDVLMTESALRKGCGDLRGALKILMQTCLLYPANMAAWSAMVQWSIDLGDFAYAERMIEQAPAHGALEAWHIAFLKGQLEMARWNVQAAYQHFAKAAKQHASPAWAHECAARAAMLRADVPTVLAHMKQSVDANSTHRIMHGGQSKPAQTHIGQIVDEYRIEAEGCARLRKIIEAGSAIEELSALVRDYPDFTPAAISFMVALQKAALRAATASRRGDLIPKSIVQFWYGDLPADVEAYCASWTRYNGAYTYRRFTDEDARAFLSDNYESDVQRAYRRASEPAMKADLFRLAYLFAQGGIFVDCDDVCTAPLDHLISTHASMVLYLEELGSVGNDFIAAKAGHPVVELALRDVVTSINRGDVDMLWLSTGPGLMTRSVARCLSGTPEEANAQVRVLQRHELFSAVSIHNTASYKHTDLHWSRTAFRRHRARLLSQMKASIG